MTHTAFTPRSFELLEGLRDNNNREWFNEHKQEFREQLQAPFAAMLEAASKKLKNRRHPMSGGKETMFRIYRDVRFSKDKRPYKEHVSGLLTPSGVKDDDGALAYAHLDCDGGFVAAGFYNLPTARLNKIRDRILEDASGFRSIVSKLTRAGFEFAELEPLRSMPRGFSSYRDHEHAHRLRLKSFIIREDLTRRVWLQDEVVSRIMAIHKAASGVIQFGVEAMADS